MVAGLRDESNGREHTIEPQLRGEKRVLAAPPNSSPCLAALNYRELSTPIWRGLTRQGGGNGKRRVHKLRNGPRPFCNANGLSRRCPQRLMDTAKIIMRNVQRDRRNVVVQLLAKAIRQPREPARSHAKRKVLPFNVAGRNVLLRIARYYFTAYSYYLSRAVAGHGILCQIGYAVGLYDDAVGGVVAEGVTDRGAVGMKAIRANLGLANDAAAEIMQEVHRAFGIPLADAPTDDGLLRPGHADKHVLITLGVDLVAFDVLLFFANEAPSLVKF